MNENNVLLTVILFALLFFITTTYYWYGCFKFATELYCKSQYSNNVIQYEQCKEKDLVILLQGKKEINAR